MSATDLKWWNARARYMVRKMPHHKEIILCLARAKQKNANKRVRYLSQGLKSCLKEHADTASPCPFHFLLVTLVSVGPVGLLCHWNPSLFKPDQPLPGHKRNSFIMSPNALPPIFFISFPLWLSLPGNNKKKLYYLLFEIIFKNQTWICL